MAPVGMDGLVASRASTHDLVVDFLFLDLETCTRCRATNANLDAALAEVGHILDMAGRAVLLRKTLVASVEEARALGFVSSPTIRVNGRDVARELRESNCQECGDACGCGGEIDCRVWVWQGQEHTEAPLAMIVDAILREVYGDARQAVVPGAAATPENLERFFAGKQELQQEAAPCCGPAKQASCCEPSQKASCCGDASSSSCGCQ